jgi:predicted dehydrogenase
VIILIIGLGSVGKKHVAAIRQLKPDAVIYALRSSREAETYEKVKNIFSLDEMTVRPDFVIISNPTSVHKTSLADVMQLECPVFIEKPVFNTLDNADELLKQISNKKLITYIACNMRFHPAIKYIRAYLQDSKQQINEVNIYCGSYLPDWRPDKDFRTSYSANANMGGGVHLDLIHELDYCTWLFGAPLSVNSLKTSNSSLKIDAIDDAHFQFRYVSFTASISLNYYRKDAKREIEIVMEDKTLVADLLLNRISNKTSGEILYEEAFSMNDTYLSQMNYFISHINQQQQPMNSIEEGIAVLKLALHE